MRVATVVLNYRAPADTARAVATVRTSTFLDQRIFVVDNAPDGAEHRELAALVGPGVECIPTGGNLGYAGGNNVGIRRALADNAEFVWVLNPDTEVNEQTLGRLVAAADEVPDAAVVGARIVMPGGRRIWFDGGLVDDERFGSASHLNAGADPRRTPADGIRDVDYVTGACMLLRSAAIRMVGELPEEYFLYFEETAFCRDVRAAGWRVIVEPRASLVHHKRSSGDLPMPYFVYYYCRNRLRFAQRYYGATVDRVVPDLERVFAGPWRERVERHAPAWLPSYDQLVARAIDDARAGRAGRVPEIDDWPKPAPTPEVPSHD
ncbi:MAG TPA: glycosyltransferase family 2 protein [Sporichthya sp.]|nr:glycosyltransferase family 2 protein [Sporichthya sp.]